jgi:RNA polymerase sigma-70 factor (ECF subfamily)
MSPALPTEGLDQELLALVNQAGRDGWTDATFEAIYRRYHKRFLSSFLRQVHRPDVAQELTQDLMMNIARSSGRFDALPLFEAWMTTVAQNVLKNHWRSSGTQKRKGTEVADDEAAGERGQLPDPFDEAARSERAAKVTKALAQLPKAMRNAAVLRYRQDRSYEEIAKLLGVSTNTVKSHLFDARARLTELLGDLAED